MEWMDHAIRKHADLKDRFPIIHTGFLELDSMAPLLRRGTVSLFGSRPGMGRSTLAAQIAANIADSGGYVVWFTTVLSVGEIVEKILRVKPDFQCPQNIALEDRVGDGRELQQAVMELGQRIDLVVVDDLQGMYRISRGGQAIFDAARICADLRDFARSQNMAVLLLSRLTRASEYRSGYHPISVDIPHWESIKRVVDSVFLLHRDGYYTGDTSQYQVATIAAGPSIDRCAVLSLLWDKMTGRFLPYDARLL